MAETLQQQARRLVAQHGGPLFLGLRQKTATADGYVISDVPDSRTLYTIFPSGTIVWGRREADPGHDDTRGEPLLCSRHKVEPAAERIGTTPDGVRE